MAAGCNLSRGFGGFRLVSCSVPIWEVEAGDHRPVHNVPAAQGSRRLGIYSVPIQQAWLPALCFGILYARVRKLPLHGFALEDFKEPTASAELAF